jgi:hypothetical protein
MYQLLRSVVLALATLGSSWAAYQAARWGGVQTINFDKANALRAESVRAANQAMQQAQVDVTTFVSWSLAKGQGNEATARFLRERFRKEFVPAFDSWLASADRPGTVPAGTPFQRPEYDLAYRTEAQRLTTEADAAAIIARHANQTSDNFMFSVVLFATVVFLAGVDVGKGPRASRWFVSALAIACLTLGLAFLLRLPINVGF